jgi:hypothetical protein
VFQVAGKDVVALTRPKIGLKVMLGFSLARVFAEKKKEK